jgi:polar amino acid transport system substrate-binding protein
MMRHGAGLLAAVLLTALLTGCGSGADRAQRMTLAALNAAVAAPSSSTTTRSSAPTACGDVTASLRPPAVQPAPGAMPPGSFMARIEKRGYLIAGVDQNTMLFAYFNPVAGPGGRVEGFEIDLLRRLAQAIFGDPNRIQLKAITTAERIAAIQSGSVDVVADAMTITCARRRQVDFSSVYYDAKQRILVASDSPAGSVADLGGKPVCATVGSTSLDTLLRLTPRPTPYTVAQRTDCLVALQQGLVSAITSDDSILLGFKAQDPDTKIVGPWLADEPYGMAISPAHPDFVRFVNGVLAGMRANGSWRAIYSRWLGRLVPTIPAPPPAHYGG